jgi:hypothetical protein
MRCMGRATRAFVPEAVRYGFFSPFLTGAERVEHERQRAEHECQRAERLAVQLGALGVEPQDA